MPTSTIRSTYNVGGIALGSEVTRTQEGQIGQSHTLDVASDGVQLAFTGIDDITVTLAAAHAAVNGTVDVYWYVDGVLYVHFGATVAIVGQVATLTLGDGDDYVTGEGTLAMNIVNQQDIDIDFDGDLVELMVASCDKVAHIEWKSGAEVSITGTKILAGEAWEWLLNSEYTNALAGEVVTSASISTYDPDNTVTLRIGILHSSE